LKKFESSFIWPFVVFKKAHITLHSAVHHDPNCILQNMWIFLRLIVKVSEVYLHRYVAFFPGEHQLLNGFFFVCFCVWRRGSKNKNLSFMEARSFDRFLLNCGSATSLDLINQRWSQITDKKWEVYNTMSAPV
jgi:hypothetical protein